MQCNSTTFVVARPLLWSFALLVTAALLVGSLFAQSGEDAFVKWASTRAIPVSIETDGSFADLQKLKPMIGDASVVAIGETTHGAHEPLAFRNRLIRFLVEQTGFTAVALEAGFTESWALHSFVAGGPGELRTVVQDGFTWGFGSFAENEELVKWARDYNADPAHSRKVRFYGMDLTGGRNGRLLDARRSIDFALTFLAGADSAGAKKTSAAMESILERFSDDKYKSLSPAEAGQLERGVSQIEAALIRSRSELVRRSSADEYDWALHSLVVARQEIKMFRVSPALDGKIPATLPPDAGAGMMARDSAMAANVEWVLQKEGTGGRIIVFAHNGHVMNSVTEGGVWAPLRENPSMMGSFLRRSLGKNMVIIGTSSANAAPGLPSPEPLEDAIDSALAKVGQPRFILDLRPARENGDAFAWLSAKRPIRANVFTHAMVTTSNAFDALVFVDTLTPAHQIQK